MKTARAGAWALACFVSLPVLEGCSSPGRTNNATLGAVVSVFTPAAEIEQIYYLGVIDPIEQLPEAIYRVRVRGQASAISNVTFGSKWVPAWAVDALTAKAGNEVGDKNFSTTAYCQNPQNLSACVPPVGRGLVQFGPERFRNTPTDQRLVIVMGADPSKFFDAIDQTLGTIAEVKQDNDNADLRKHLTASLLKLKDSQGNLRTIQLQLLEEGLK
ncbi:MAG: hypothetical protein ACT4P9_03105 [Betaproteobacteria bacterium]